ncbi:hypothetical protein GCM10022281_20660 [Sphingomonas rosea]|uniref:PrgI family protein n=1 Tax=Sphingomonas rosea TaxID=335605 RepID=A0ABP7UDS6_9SPHN
MSFKLTGPDHWRYRYAARFLGSRLMLALQVLLVGAFLAALFLQRPAIMVAGMIVAAPFIIPAAGLGCWRCNYNLLRRYRGSGSIEHGDSWTGEPDTVGMLNRIPNRCPKCQATILTEEPLEVRTA